MKLSAPPPTPPEPPEQPDATPPDETPATPSAKPAPKPATWPGWFGGADAALALLAVVLAFLVASFAARNSDLWVHLAAGKMLTTGEYKLGSDPFSYTGVGRVWVNHSWLFDLGAYLLYSGTGFALVLLKAVAVAGAAGLLMAIRRPAFPLWPWAACATLFALAVAPRLALGPLVGSILFLAATLFIVFKVPAKRVVVAIGVLFWFWANIDAWFFVGPLALALLLIGELLQPKHLRKPEDVGEEPLAALPPVPVLAKALAVGVVACMLNPHHVRVWELPFELVGSAVGKTDPEIARNLLLSPIDATYSKGADLGYNLNGLAYAVLLVAGGATLGFGFGRLRVAHLALWLGFAVLSLLSVFAVPFFAVVAVPLIAGQLNAASARVKLGTKSAPGTRLLVVGSAGGRVVSLVGLVAMCVCAWPGWLHPQPSEPAAARRVAWAVEPDPALVKAAEQVQAWREAGHLPADARGVFVSLALANYCAWYAPSEKVFINSRYNHHSGELPDYAALRLALGLRARDGPPDVREAGEILAKNKAEYLGYSAVQRRTGPVPITSMLLVGWDNWAGWYTDGRTAVFGWRPSPAETPPTFDKLRLDAVALAVGPRVTKLPGGKVQPVPRPREWEDDFTRPARPPPEVDEALGWLAYKQSLAEVYDMHQRIGFSMFLQIPAAQGLTFHQRCVESLARSGIVGAAPPRGDAFRLAPVLALRAARRAIAANPDHPDGYLVLAQVLQDPTLPMSESDRQIAIITACRQCLSRLPSPEEMSQQTPATTSSIASPMRIALRLVQLYLNPDRNGQFRGLMLEDDPVRRLAGFPLQDQQRQLVGFRFLPLDLVRTLLIQTTEYAKIELAGEEEASRKTQLDNLQGLTKAVEDQLRVRNDAFKRDQGLKVTERYNRARQFELPGEAITILKSTKGEDLVKEFGAGVTQTLLELIALELCCGRLEDAAADLADLKEVFDDLTRQAEQPVRNAMKRALRMLDQQKMMLEGDYAGAGAELEGLEGKEVGLQAMLEGFAQQKANPILAALAKHTLDPKAAEREPNQTLTPKPFSAMGWGWPSVPMVGAQSPLDAYTMYCGGYTQFQYYAFLRDQLAAKLQADSQFFYRRGFLSLIEGDIPAAKERFRQARRTPPPDWNLPPIMISNAESFLRMIEAAERK